MSDSEPCDLTTDTLIGTTITPDQIAAAGQLVLRHAVQGAWTGEELLTVLQALGLHKYDVGARYGPEGRRIALTKEAQ